MSSTKRMKVHTMAVTQTAPTAAPNGAAAVKTRTKKVDMPFRLTFLDDKNQEVERVPPTATAVKATFSDGKVAVISLKDVPAQTKVQLEADALRRRLAMALKDLTKETVKEAPGITADFLKSLKSNSIYVAREGGGGVGRVFDYDFWVTVFDRASKAKIAAGNTKVKEMTEKDKVSLRTRLEAMTPDERNAKKKEWEAKDPVIRKVAALLRVERDAAKSKDADYDPMAF